MHVVQAFAWELLVDDCSAAQAQSAMELLRELLNRELVDVNAEHPDYGTLLHVVRVWVGWRVVTYAPVRSHA